MKIDIRLHRDKKRLAQTKLATLADDHPLREKYFRWIQELDDLMGGCEARLPQRDFPRHKAVVQVEPRGADDAGEVLGEQIDRKAIDMPVVKGVACHDKPADPAQANRLTGSASVHEQRKQELLAQNQWLRNMLERYGNLVEGEKSNVFQLQCLSSSISDSR